MRIRKSAGIFGAYPNAVSSGTSAAPPVVTTAALPLPESLFNLGKAEEMDLAAPLDNFSQPLSSRPDIPAEIKVSIHISAFVLFDRPLKFLRLSPNNVDTIPSIRHARVIFPGCSIRSPPTAPPNNAPA